MGRQSPLQQGGTIVKVGHTAHASRSVGSWPWFPVAYAVLVIGVSSAALFLEAVGRYSGLLGAALSIGAMPALAGAIGLVFYATFLFIGLIEKLTDSQLVSALHRKAK